MTEPAKPDGTGPDTDAGPHAAFFHKHTFSDAEIHSTERHHLLSNSLFSNPRRIRFFSPHLHVHLVFHSRAHRKNRHPKIVQDDAVVIAPAMPTLWNGTSDLRNISWHVAVWFCLGSLCWIVNGQYALMQSSSQHVVNAIGWSGFAGGTCFWIGAYLAVVESLNLNNNLLYGAEVERVFGKLRDEIVKLKGLDNFEDERTAVYCHKDPTGATGDCRSPWRWVGYSNTIGFWASFIQFIGATMFEIAVICGIPGVIDADQWELQQTFIWTMQTVGSVAFILSSWIMMIEEQDNLWMPKVGRMGWESGFWNLIGSFGFLLSAVFGYLANWEGRGVVCCQLAGTAVSTYWGSWAFMIASLALYYEVENKKEQSLRETIRAVMNTLNGAGRKERDGGPGQAAKEIERISCEG